MNNNDPIVIVGAADGAVTSQASTSGASLPASIIAATKS